jgi:hypothetical protein
MLTRVSYRGGVRTQEENLDEKNKKWLSKWNIKLHECPNTKEEIKSS